jgi:phosphate-selective porin OprO/OprP
MIPLLALLACLQDKPSEETPLDVFYKDGLRFKTRDGTFEGYLNGYLRIHGRTIFDRPDDGTAPLRTVPDTIWMREARLETGGTFNKKWAYRFQLEFDSGAYNQSTGAAPSGVTTLLQDGWVEWRADRAFNVRLGQFQIPCSAEEYDSTRAQRFAERSPMNRLVPGREMGLEVHGGLLENRLTYLAAVCHGQGYLKDKGRGTVDGDDEKEAAFLLHAFPLDNVRLSLGGSIGGVDDTPASNFDLISYGLTVLYLDSTAGTFDGLRKRGSAAVTAWSGPAGLRAEILYREDGLKDSPEDDLESLGWTVSGSLLLTGEDHDPFKRVVPGRDWGALELAVRYARVDVRNAFDAGIAAPAGNSEKVSETTVALTWWHGEHLRVTLQATHEEFEDPLRFDNREEDSLIGLVARVQLNF